MKSFCSSFALCVCLLSHLGVFGALTLTLLKCAPHFAFYSECVRYLLAVQLTACINCVCVCELAAEFFILAFWSDAHVLVMVLCLISFACLFSFHSALHGIQSALWPFFESVGSSYWIHPVGLFDSVIFISFLIRSKRDISSKKTIIHFQIALFFKKINKPS